MLKLKKYLYFVVFFLSAHTLLANSNPFFKTFLDIEKEQNTFLSDLKQESLKQKKNKLLEAKKSKLAELEKKEKIQAYIKRRVAEYEAYEQREIKEKKVFLAKSSQALRVTATAYTSHFDECKTNPFLGAWDNPLVPGSKSIAVSRDLLKKYGFKNGTKVRISGLPGIYSVRDTMHQRYSKRIDIYMGMDKHRALRWGEKSVVIYWD